MKKSIYMIACLLLIAGQAATAQLTSSQEVSTPELAAKRETIKKEVINNYMTIKQLLIVSDSVNTAKEAVKFIVSLEQFRFKKLSLPDMNAATSLRREIKDLAITISKTNNINKQRKVFALMSEKMWIIAPKVKAVDMVLYRQVCPMTGESWLSMEKGIKNPYYPKNMLICGEVKQSI